MRKCIWFALGASCWSLLALTASAQVVDPAERVDPRERVDPTGRASVEPRSPVQRPQVQRPQPQLQVPQPQLQGLGAGGQGMGGQPLPGFVQNPGQFPLGLVPGGQGMGGQGLPPGMQPTMPIGQIMQLRALQMMGAGHRGVQYGAGGNNLNNTMNGYNNPNFAVPNTPQIDPEQLKKDERRSKVKERAEMKRAKEKEQAELRKLKAQEAKNNAPQAKVEGAKQ